jgi:hypothetical protein
MMDYAEKRDFQRMALDCSLEYQLVDNETVHQGKVVNLSAKGVLFIAEQALSKGDSVKIKLTPVNTITPPMSANATVARCDKQAEKEYEVACEIVQIL